MTELLTAAQMRAIERAAIESGEVTGLELMERAGEGVVEAIFEEWPELAGRGASPSRSPEYLIQEEGRRAVILCGPGNNGGDGFVVARLLHERGWEVAVFLYGDPDKLPPDARVNYERWEEIGEVGNLSVRNALADLPMPDLLIDAVFGTGLTRRVEGELAFVLQSLDGLRAMSGLKVIAVDLPSGLCSDSGRHLGVFSTADLTVSFHRFKIGHYVDLGPKQCGRAVVKSIGIEQAQTVPQIAAVQQVGTTGKRALKDGDHKYTHGHALILSGGAGKTGAARLAARGALRIGAGLVTLGVPHEAQAEVAAQITALMMREIGDVGALKLALEDDRVNALCLGPGMGLERARDLVPEALEARGPGSGPGRGVVLDADALTAFADAPEALFDMLHDACVLTPHAGEFARLFPDIAKRLREEPTSGTAYSKVDAAREAAKRAGCVVLFKGPDTVIAAPDGRCSINSAAYEREAPWLATAGSGDVLAGFITGLMARGFAPMQAAEAAAWLHVECALEFGPGLIAEDLPEVLPKVLQKLEQ